LLDMDQTNLKGGWISSLWTIRNYECSM